MEMREKIARAMYDATPFKETEGGYNQQSDIYRRMCLLLADAALTAIGETHVLVPKRLPDHTIVKFWQTGMLPVPQATAKSIDLWWEELLSLAAAPPVKGG